jgi:hypothetical protein
MGLGLHPDTFYTTAPDRDVAFCLMQVAKITAMAAAVASAIVAEIRYIIEVNPFLWQAHGIGLRPAAAPRLLASDWFCGVGGSSNGAQHAGCVIVRAIECQATLRKLYTKSFGVIPGGDVRMNVDDAAPLAPARSIDIQMASFECSTFSQAGAQAGLSDRETVVTLDQVFLRLRLEQPDGVLLENVRGLVTMADGEVLRWVLEGVRGAGYVTAHSVDSPPSLGLCFNRPRLHIMALRIDLVHRSWWARMNPRTWFTPLIGTRFSVVSDYLESPYASRELLESRGARFVAPEDIRFLDGDFTPSPPDVAQVDRPFVRCHWTMVPVHHGMSPAETCVIALHGPVVKRWLERNGNRVYSTRGLAPTMVRRGPFRTSVFMIPGSSPGAKHKRDAVFRTLTADECSRILELEGMHMTQYAPGGVIPDDAWEVRSAQIVAPPVNKRLVGILGSLIDSTRTLAEMHTTKECIERPLGFHPESRTDLISPAFDAVVARHTSWLLERDSAILRGETPARPRLSLAIFGGLEDVHVHIVSNTLVIHLELYLNQHAWGQVWRSAPGEAPVRVTPAPVHTVSLAASLVRGDLSGSSGELLAHILPQRGCYGGSMISPMLVILACNSDRFIGDARAVEDIDNEVAAECLVRFSGADLEIIPYCSIKQNVTDKKIAAHLKAQGQQPKVRRISDKKSGESALLSPNAWVDSSSMMGLDLTRLDDMLAAVVAMCAMAMAMNTHEIERIGANDASRAVYLHWSVYMHAGDASRAYRNLRSCPTEVWKSGLYDVRLDKRMVPRLYRYVDLALDFGGEANPAEFCWYSYCLVISWAVILRLLSGMLAPLYVVPAMEHSRAIGFTREHRLRHFEMRQHNDMPEQDDVAPAATHPPACTVGGREPQLDETETEFHRIIYERSKVPRALSHPDTCQSSLDMFRASSYSDDFTMVQIDTPELRRVRGGRAALQQVGEESNLPFGASKWADGAPTQDLVCLGIGFDVTDPERPLVYVPDESVEEVVFIMRDLVDKQSAPVSAIGSLASKLLRQTMVVERGRLYVCGLFAATRHASAGRFGMLCNTLRHRRGRVYSRPKRKHGEADGEDTPTADSVPITQWARRNMQWWLKYYESGSPRTLCVAPRVTFRGDIEADACGIGYGGFFIVGHTMFFFAGLWSTAEVASFNATGEKTLNINVFELVTQHMLVYTGVIPALGAPFVGHTIMPKCDNEISVVLKESYRARNEHMATILEDLDHLTAKHRVCVQMVHISGVNNRVSDILSRDGVCAAFYAQVATDFPVVTAFQNVTDMIPTEVRSLSKLL